MSSLCANREKCYEVKNRFDKMWNAAEILKFVESLNRYFYPVPIIRTFNKDPATGGSICHVTDGFLTKDELAKAHGLCGDLLHADNPYRNRSVSVRKWRQRFVEWDDKTKVLLKLHTTQLVDRDTQWWVVMRFGSSQPVQVAEMKTVEKDDA